MEPALLLKGLALGFAIAAPVGPIGVLCIRRTLADGRIYGLVTGVGAATADMLYGGVAVFGLSLVTTFLIGLQTWLRGIGGLFLIYLGIKTFVTLPAERPAAVGRGGLANAYLTTLVLTLSNPATILSFIGIFAGLGAASQVRGNPEGILLVLGVFCGSVLWWLILSSLAGAFRSRMTGTGLVWVNRLSGGAIVVFGLAAMISLVWR